MPDHTCLQTEWLYWLVLLLSAAALATSAWVHGYTTANRKNYEANLRMAAIFDRKQQERNQD